MRMTWLLLLIACQSHASAVATTPDKLVVHFGSICCGTDRAAESRLEAAVANTPHVEQTRAHWGKEGETDACFDLSALDPSARAAFVQRVRDAVAGGENVTIDNGTCHADR